MDLQYRRDRLLFCFAVVQSLCAVRYYSDGVLFAIKYVSRVNFDSRHCKIKVENTILRFQFHLNILLLEQRIAKISSQQKFQSSRTAKICSRKPQKIANPQNKTPAKFLCYTVDAPG